ncbi:N-acetylmuramoyl-L-alanine amidase [Liquorilactobacillus sucicola DSM 21376 = JCM 15457]|uniref:glycoside hydrolase family 73 protein n=1 Tax=Liquorilactobacillus sucicola TaxID=519050 RepID=UPI000436C902|nr:glycoside hydrolase family 73 protein [Liquorilactobacillus sucicola]GAJ27260.1 N-acetylmuramoyl-L-alanine amidase [Liquorilactobacillus sucicola DSM 21376 = JCM 15457]
MAKKRRKKTNRKKKGFLIVNGKLQITNVLVLVLVISLLTVQVMNWLGKYSTSDNNDADTTQINDNTKRNFINQILPVAQKEQRQHQLLTSITLAQAALESNWGQSQLASRYHNLFGVKSDAANAQLMTTAEYVNGQWITVKAKFATYKDWNESIEAHTRLFVNGTGWDQDHYRSVLAAKDYREAAAALQKQGYATDPGYAQKLIQIIQEYQLDRYDKTLTK